MSLKDLQCWWLNLIFNLILVELHLTVGLVWITGKLLWIAYCGLLGKGYLDKLRHVWIKSKASFLVSLFLMIHMLCECNSDMSPSGFLKHSSISQCRWDRKCFVFESRGSPICVTVGRSGLCSSQSHLSRGTEENTVRATVHSEAFPCNAFESFCMPKISRL